MQSINQSQGIPIKNLLASNLMSVDQIDYNFVFKTQPVLFCHDQEPLNFDLYCDNSEYVENYRDILSKNPIHTSNIRNTHFINSNLRWTAYGNIQKSWTLLHSEINSLNLNRYESSGRFVGAYWWSHAIIARDWYRFAEHDSALIPTKNPTKLFLTYCRADTGSREYRKDFRRQISERLLSKHCQFISVDNNPLGSNASAVYNTHDYNSTGISVVLETVFDERIHLTEKILRPIACGHPFILAAGPGSLQLLRTYGFQTFSEYINENYDNIQDNKDRLAAITQEMQRIQQLPKDKLYSLLKSCQLIAKHNRQRFFSQDFFNQVVNELIDNVDIAWQQHQGGLDLELWWNSMQWYKKNKLRHLIPEIHRQIFIPLYRNLRKSGPNNYTIPTIT
jgi:hypothetical protein